MVNEPRPRRSIDTTHKTVDMAACLMKTHDSLPIRREDSAQSTHPTEEATQPPYSVFPRSTIWYFTYLLGYLALASSLTATIYFPLIDLLAKDYHTSIQTINLTITLYVVFQGIAPSFFSPLSDTFGRRPVLLTTFAIYLVAGIGLVVNTDSYVALLLLRALQSIGGSAVLSLAYAIVADIVPHSQRGSVLGPMMAATNLGPCVGPVLGGGAILASGNVRWCFVALVAFGVTALMLIGWTMPETGRAIVGNGAVKPHGLWATWYSASISAFGHRLKVVIRKVPGGGVKRASGNTVPMEHLATQIPGGNSVSRSDSSPDPPSTSFDNPNIGKTGRGKLSVPNPLPSIRIIFYPDTALTLWLCAAPYTVWYCIQTSIPLIYGPGYGFNDLQVGLCFLAGGGGVIAGGWIAGRLMDWSFRRTSAKAGFNGDKRAVDIARFPIEEARSTGSIPIMLVSMGAVAGYGWAVQTHTHPAVPLLLQFYIGAKCTVIHQIYSALIVDVFPARPGTAGASNNICRCALSAAAVAVLQPAVKAIGYSWLFTLLALVEGVGSIVAVYILRRWGWGWREKRDKKLSNRDSI